MGALNSAEFDQFMTKVNGITQVDWLRFYGFIDSNSIALEPGASEWDALLETWLGCAARDLGGKYQLSKSDNFFFLSAHSPDSAHTILKFAESALGSIEELVPEIRTQDKWRLVLVQIHEAESYLNYSEYHSGGYAVSTAAAGMFLPSAGYQHIVMGPIEAPAIETTIAHELAHYCLAQHDPPLWLDEGMAVTIERTLSGRQIMITREDMNAHRALWSEENIKKFLDGTAFAEFDATLTYGLAEILVHGILQTDRAKLFELVKASSREDGGNEAFLAHFGVDVRDMILGFLEQDF
ncbi:MAG: hypothetical protein V4760_00930 [Bdellovibrionota bacterium]